MNYYDLEKKYIGKKYVEVINLADSGDLDAAEFLRLDDEHRKNIGSWLAIAFATSEALHPCDDPALKRYLTFLSRKSIFYVDRWHGQHYRNNDGKPKPTVNNISLKNGYESMLLEYGYIQEKLYLPRPSEYYYLFYHYLVACAHFLAWTDYPKSKKRRHLIGQDRGHTLKSAIRVEIERYIFDGTSTATKQFTDVIRQSQELVEDPLHDDDMDYASRSDSPLSEFKRQYILYKSLSNTLQVDSDKKPNVATINGGHYDIEQSLIDDLLSEYNADDRELLQAFEYGELEKIAQQRGVKENTLAQRRKRLISKIKKTIK